jgi:hypothetical protein
VSESITEVKQMVAHVTNFKNDIKVLEDVVLHHLSELVQYITAIVEASEKHEFYQIGVEVGKIVNLLQIA